MLISACVIVKNEEKTLPTWLACVKQIADEIVVVDTGSTDRTVELAKEAGARVEHFHWINDFSAARNYAIEQVQGKWILFLDADQYFLPEDCRRVKEAIRKYDARPKVVSFIFHIVDIDQTTGRKRGSEAYNVHCFRNVTWLRYERKIHEILVNRTEKKGIAQYLGDVILYHTGYSEDRIRQKCQRNLEILLEAQKEGEYQEVDDLYFADCYYGMKEYEKALHHAELAVKHRVRAIGMEKRPYGVVISCMRFLKYPAEKVNEVLAEAEKEFPEAPEFQLTRGLQDWDARDYYEAEQRFLRGLELYEREQNQPRQSLTTTECRHSLPVAYFCLGEMAAWRGRKQEAVEYLLKVLQLEPGKWEVLPRLSRLLADVPAADFIACFNEFCVKERDGKALAGIFSKLGMGEAALYYEKCSGEKLFDDVDRCILAGRVSAAGDRLRGSVRELCDLGSWQQVFHAPDNRKDLWKLLPEAYQKAAAGQNTEEAERIRSVWRDLDKKYNPVLSNESSFERS